MNYDFIRFNGIENQKWKSPDDTTSKVSIPFLIHSRISDDAFDCNFNTIQKIIAEPSEMPSIFTTPEKLLKDFWNDVDKQRF